MPIENKSQLVRTIEYKKRFQESLKEFKKDESLDPILKNAYINSIKSMIEEFSKSIKEYKEKEKSHERGNDGKDK